MQICIKHHTCVPANWKYYDTYSVLEGQSFLNSFDPKLNVHLHNFSYRIMFAVAISLQFCVTDT